MFRIVVCLCLATTAPAVAQIAPQNPNAQLEQQLLPESFKVEASAITAPLNSVETDTTLTYSVTNNSGMNLYAGLAPGSASLGTCRDARQARGLMFLPGGGSYYYDPSVGEARAAFLTAGGRVAGSIFFVDCDGPNPGFATAPLTLALMLGRANNFAAMIVFPLSVEVALRLRNN